MTSKEILVGMIRSINQEILDEYKITLRSDDLTFTDPISGSFEGGMNTSIIATSHHPLVIGSNVYYYKRRDMQEAFDELGAPQPSVKIEGRVDVATVLDALKAKYDFYIQLEDLVDFEVSETMVTFKVPPTHYIWTGELTVLLTEVAMDLAETFTNNVLNGLTAVGGTVPTDGGNYDQLTGSL